MDDNTCWSCNNRDECQHFQEIKDLPHNTRFMGGCSNHSDYNEATNNGR